MSNNSDRIASTASSSKSLHLDHVALIGHGVRGHPVVIHGAKGCAVKAWSVVHETIMESMCRGRILSTRSSLRLSRTGGV